MKIKTFNDYKVSNANNNPLLMPNFLFSLCIKICKTSEIKIIMNNKTKNLIYIFSKYIKNNNKIIPFKVKRSDVGNTKYFPPVSRE
jgi:hypothetical protein